jgi:transposase-like protein
VISVVMLTKVRRMHLRDGLSIREESRRTGLSRNTVRQWLRQQGVPEPKYPKRQARPSPHCGVAGESGSVDVHIRLWMSKPETVRLDPSRSAR